MTHRELSVVFDRLLLKAIYLQTIFLFPTLSHVSRLKIFNVSFLQNFVYKYITCMIKTDY